MEGPGWRSCIAEAESAILGVGIHAMPTADGTVGKSIRCRWPQRFCQAGTADTVVPESGAVGKGHWLAPRCDGGRRTDA